MKVLVPFIDTVSLMTPRREAEKLSEFIFDHAIKYNFKKSIVSSSIFSGTEMTSDK